MDQKTVGVFGSAFNPPTLGHLSVLNQSKHLFDRILLVPSYVHPFSKKMLSFKRRIDLLNCFMNDLDIIDCTIELCELEKTLSIESGGKCIYTFDLLVYLENLYQEKISFIRGPDNAMNTVWSRFYKAEEIETRWDIYTADELVIIRSSMVRQLFVSSSCKKLLERKLNNYLTPTVKEYLLKYNVY